MRMITIPEDEKHVIDILVAAASVWSFLTEALPTIMLMLTAIWTIIRIYETPTVQRLFNKEARKDAEDSDTK